MGRTLTFWTCSKRFHRSQISNRKHVELLGEKQLELHLALQVVSAYDTSLNRPWLPWAGSLAHQASALELLQLDTYISFSSWSLDASSWSTCSCCWARLSSWDVLSRSLSSSWLVSFSLVFSTLVSSLPLRSCVHSCSNWGGRRKEKRKLYNWLRHLGSEAFSLGLRD